MGRKRLRLLAVLKSKKGYALLVVVCLLLVIAVLGTNVLVAAYASSGTAARRKISSQAYLYASSLLPNVSAQVEEGAFDDFIEEKLLATGSENPAEIKKETLTDTFTEPETGRPVTITLTMYVKDVSFAPDDPIKIEATLVVRVTARYEGEEYTLAGQFNQRPLDEAGAFAWTLSG